jgi:hypothetical protein
MTDQGNGNWIAAIPAQAAGSEVYYYVQGTANSGKTQARPMVAPDGWWHFRVLDIASSIGGAAAPVIAEVFPNPTSSVLVATIAAPKDERVDVRLADVLGRTVTVLHQGVLHADRRVIADISALPEAPYMLVVTSANGRSAVRVVKQ